LAERQGPSADHGHIRTSPRALRPSSPLSRRERGTGGEDQRERGTGGALPDGRTPQDDADAGTATRGARPGDAAERTPARRRRRGHYDLRSDDRRRSLDVPRAVVAAGRHSTPDRARRVSGRERLGYP